MRKPFVILAILVSLPLAAHAEVYCVGTAGDLRTAFGDARSSPAASEIRVRTGFYVLPPLNGQPISLQYAAGSSLTMSGGWSDPACTGQISDPEQTVLSADNGGTLLRFFLLAGAATQIELTNFSFRQASGTTASCLEFESDAGSDAVVRIDRNAFRLCNASSSGGSAVRATARSVDFYLRNNIFTDNASTTGVVNLSGFGGSIFYVSNNTIANNPQFGAGGGPGGMQVSAQANDIVWLSNNVLWNNGTGNGYDLLINSNTPVVLNSNLIGEAAPFPAGAVNNGTLLGVDPRFTNSVDFRPRADSPMRDSGANPNGGALSFDFDGSARVQGARIDRGAFEFGEVFADGFE
jgi:hypothetical protein